MYSICAVRDHLAEGALAAQPARCVAGVNPQPLWRDGASPIRESRNSVAKIAEALASRFELLVLVRSDSGS
jgi:hypothetical protein